MGKASPGAGIRRLGFAFVFSGTSVAVFLGATARPFPQIREILNFGGLSSGRLKPVFRMSSSGGKTTSMTVATRVGQISTGRRFSYPAPHPLGARCRSWAASDQWQRGEMGLLLAVLSSSCSSVLQSPSRLFLSSSHHLVLLSFRPLDIHSFRYFVLLSFPSPLLRRPFSSPCSSFQLYKSDILLGDVSLVGSK